MNRALKLSWYAVLTAIALWGSGVIPAIIPAAVPTAFKQGNSAKFQLAGTVAGTGATLCTDASGNTTTSGCSGGGGATITMAFGVFASLPSCTNVLNEIYHFTDSAYDQAYCLTGATDWTYFYRGMALTPPASGSYTFMNQRGSTLVTTTGGSLLTFPTTGGATTTNDTLWYLAYPAGTFTITVALAFDGSLSHFTSGGLGISDGTKLEILGVGGNQGTGGPAVDNWMTAAVSTFANVTTFTATVGTPFTITPYPMYFMRFQDNGTNRIWSFSPDGVQWIQMLSETRTTFLTPTRIGIWGQPENLNGGDLHLLVTHWLQQ